MLNQGLKSFFVLTSVVIFFACIDPYTPKLKGYDSLLVVDALITDANTSNSVKLTTTIQSQNEVPSTVSDATVFITDDAGGTSYLTNKGNGIYKTDSLAFRGVAGKTYILHIITREGKEYESDPCPMMPVADIDSIYYEKDQQTINNGTEIATGLGIYLNSKGDGKNSFYRWDFEETWKFKVPYPSRFSYINENTILSLKDVEEFCWKFRKSDQISIRAQYSALTEDIVKEPITFIASDKSDKLMLEYSILVSQYSISEKEYNFWENLTKVNETGSDIFASQPFPVSSNIHNIKNPIERVQGYFQVSAMRQKRIFIPFSEIVRLQLPFYHNPCIRIEQDHFIGNIYYTWDEIYSIYCITSTYAFSEPKYFIGTTNIEKLVFTSKECANCELTGTSKKPDFWVDLK